MEQVPSTATRRDVTASAPAATAARLRRPRPSGAGAPNCHLVTGVGLSAGNGVPSAMSRGVSSNGTFGQSAATAARPALSAAANDRPAPGTQSLGWALPAEAPTPGTIPALRPEPQQDQERHGGDREDVRPPRDTARRGRRLADPLGVEDQLSAVGDAMTFHPCRRAWLWIRLTSGESYPVWPWRVTSPRTSSRCLAHTWTWHVPQRSGPTTHSPVCATAISLSSVSRP